MSVDIILGKISGSVARDDAEEGRLDPGDVSLERGFLLPTALGLGAAAILTWAVAGGPGKMRLAVERSYYRRTWRDLGDTQETPAVTMRELVYGPGGED